MLGKACHSLKNSDFTCRNVIWASINRKEIIRFVRLLERFGDARVLSQRFTCSTLLMNGSCDLLRVTCTYSNAVLIANHAMPCTYVIETLGQGRQHGRVV